ncbi:PREDICTED: unconventional myosin-XVIIIa-like [Priapulus caudatus]|uniref:Unconventional myosin-XVIIIa-like n=1 Tax=Priapulus caudatus TaxID=37621 RepID=A0ABM1FA05_PRICU|nr:PREDICTED: unconventional myosin-XVIIIa-like [Priapulus caudatus]
MSRDDVIELIRRSGDEVTLTVRPVLELSELTMRPGWETGDGGREENLRVVGNLARTGSVNYKHGEGRTEEQLSAEKRWQDEEHMWLMHRGGFSAARRLREDEATGLPEGKLTIRLQHGGEILQVDVEDVEKANPLQLDRTEDMSCLPNINESGLLHVLRQRYACNLVHTYAGPVMCIVNPMHPLCIYSEKVIHMLKGCKQEDMPPHVYAVAQKAYHAMVTSHRDQSVVLVGRSGSGKTTNARHALHYLAVAAGTVNKILTVEKLNAIATLMEAFGNSRTALNTNASRFTQLSSLDFDAAGQIAAASIQVYMFEKARVVRRPEGEPNFHIFYQLLAGCDSDLRRELHLESMEETSLFMTPLSRVEDKQRAALSWGRVASAVEILGIQENEAKAMWCVIAAIYHLGVAGAVTGMGSTKAQFGNPAAAQRAALLLGTSVEALSRAIFNPGQMLSARGSFRGTLNRNKPDLSLEGAINPLEALEGMVIGLYAETFNCLLSLINRCLSSNYRTVNSIIVVDSPGLQNPATAGRHSGATFEDLCHNYVQERLQYLFHENTFTAQMDRYAQEDIPFAFETSSSTPESMVNMIDKPIQSPIVIDALVEPARLKSQFVVHHLAGTSPVLYSATNWLKAARENPVSRLASTVLQDSQKENICNLFLTLRGPVPSVLSGSCVGIEGSTSLRRASSMRRTHTTGVAGTKRRSTALQVKFQMDGIVETLRRTSVHYVQCILPQHNAGLCDLKATLSSPTKNQNAAEVVMNVPLVRRQIRGAELVDTLRMNRQGYPDHVPFAQFRRRFEMLAPAEARTTGAVLDERRAVEGVMPHLDVQQSAYRLGMSMVFFRAAGALAQLESHRDEKLRGDTVTWPVREWCVWKVFTKWLARCYDVHAQRESLRAKEAEVEDLRTRLQKTEKERSELKTNHDRLEARSRYSNVSKKTQKMEMEMLELRMLRTSVMDEDDDDDDDGDDNIYKARFERAVREAEIAKKRAEKEHEEEVEQMTAVKKMLERKLGETVQEYEEQQQQAQSWKRKTVKLQSEFEDFQHQMEQQTTRNSQLERKQRKFDAELHRAQEELAEEVQKRERLLREKDEIAGESYRLEQETRLLKEDHGAAQEKLRQLQEEIEEFERAAHSKDDKELLRLRREKHDLDKKQQDQEDELDEQAGQIQQLQQAKLRLEMENEKLRQSHSKELDAHEEEMEELRTTTSKRTTICRLKEVIDHFQAEKENGRGTEQKAQEEVKKLQRELRELKEEYANLNRKESEASQRKHDLELSMETAEATTEQLQSDLRLAFKRIDDLQNALEDEIMTDSDLGGNDRWHS